MKKLLLSAGIFVAWISLATLSVNAPFTILITSILCSMAYLSYIIADTILEK